MVSSLVCRVMKTDELKDLTEEYQLLDVRLADDYAAGHLPDSVNNCVFEVSFNGRLAESAPNKSALTIVYGADSPSQEANMAAEKLRREGYENIEILDDAISSNPEIFGQTSEANSEINDGHCMLDTESSEVRWTGRNILNKHDGLLPIKEGWIELQNDRITSGSIVFDLTKITCHDLADTDLHDVLIAHLQNDDFFDTENHPEAKLEIESGHTGEVSGRLTLRGQTHAVNIPISAGVSEDGKLVAQGYFSFDRTRWGILYGSRNFFNRLAGHVVHEFIDLEFYFVAEKS